LTHVLRQPGTDQMTKSEGPGTRFSVFIIRCEPKPENSEAACDDKGDPTHWFRRWPVPDRDWPFHINAPTWNSATKVKIIPATYNTFPAH